MITMCSYLKLIIRYGHYQLVDEEMQHLEEIIANATTANDTADSLVALDEVRVQYLGKKKLN
ncbi:hypothetical protein OK016_17030 [Vibrio chagasii]|nr:hypothetical protein [Vibrio chagasii]